ncbi:hypothetical protein [Mesorhizobium sp. 2RAF21]|uniref:hypothetical protein n=1 Tax=Mesorhizobium sp. 2RAF21 TaxID=3232995 RepID=UPI003F98F681
MTATLSRKLRELELYFHAQRGMSVQISAKQVAALTDQLAIMAKLADGMETELEAFRMLEANRAGRRFMENEATEVLAASSTRAAGKILRPDFRRKS